MKNILIIFGTRPEFIKLIPVIYEFRKRKDVIRYTLLHTGQHREMVQSLFATYNVYPHYTLCINPHWSSLSDSLAEILRKLQVFVGRYKRKNKIAYILAQGDTTTSLASAMAAYFNNIPFAHLEAGLRTYDLMNPFPEEYFRRIISLTAQVHFSPTISAKRNLLKDGIEPQKILVTGNTIIDFIKKHEKYLFKKPPMSYGIKKFLTKKNNVLITCHRRENQNGNFVRLIFSIKKLATVYPQMNFIWISHSNPFIKQTIRSNFPQNVPNLFVMEPLNTDTLIRLYGYVLLIITDSGGLQEESVALNIPVIVIRRKTERMESVSAGYSTLISPSGYGLNRVFKRFLKQNTWSMKELYGDGRASEKIADYFIN